jgi:hypothetical protein
VKALRIALSLAALALGVVALALAHDVRAWDRAIDDGRAGSTWLPGDPASDLLALDDDLALRRGERAFALAVATPGGFDPGAMRAQRRAAAELALSEAVDLGSAREASRAGNLLGILAATVDDFADPGPAERGAALIFDAAIRADTSNVDAKYNLELLFRRIVVVGTQEGPSYGSGNLGDSRAGAGAGTPGSGY